jgi:hypothetical protein
LTDEQYQDVTEMLAADDAGIDLALSLARYPRGRFPISYSVDGISTKMLQIADLGAVGPGMLQPLLFARIHGGDASGALTACHALLNLGRSLGDEPFMVSQGIRQHRVGEAIRGVQRLLGQCEVPEVELAAFQAALGQEVDYDPWEIGLRGERAMMFRALEAAQRREVNSFALRVLANSPRRSATALEQVRDWLDERVGQDTRPAAAWSLRYCNRLLQAARLPWPGRRAAIETIEAELAPAPELVGYLVMRVHEAAGHFQSTQARGRCAVAALAAERYRLRHGTWPESLAALVPELLPAVSADPFDGRPLRYRKLADGVVIYSVAEDGTDDGGKLNDSHPPPPGTDVGFRLWDVPHRRQLPPETPR